MWLPSGDQLTFVSHRDGGGAVYLTDLEGRDIRRIAEVSSMNLFVGWYVHQD
jgi:Tol biopolymer transport system component